MHRDFLHAALALCAHGGHAGDGLGSSLPSRMMRSVPARS